MVTAFKQKKLGEAEFSKDMVETMLEYFDTYADAEGVLTVEIRDSGLWLPNGLTGSPQFLGLAKLPACLRHLRQ